MGRCITISVSMPIGGPPSRNLSHCRRGFSSSREKLEQLRALEAGMWIDLALLTRFHSVSILPLIWREPKHARP